MAAIYGLGVLMASLCTTIKKANLEVLALRQMGFSLEEIKKVQEGMSVEVLLLHKKAELIKKIAEENMKLSTVVFYLIHKEKNSRYVAEGTTKCKYSHLYLYTSKNLHPIICLR